LAFKGLNLVENNLPFRPNVHNRTHWTLFFIYTFT
jgi:hypothetical protein